MKPLSNPQSDAAAAAGIVRRVEVPVDELPPAEQSTRNTAAAASRGRGWLGIVANATLVAAAVGDVAWWRLVSVGQESDQNWRMVVSAGEATAAEGAERLVRVDPRGGESVVAEVRASRRDLDAALGEAFFEARLSGDGARASLLLAEAQGPSADILLAEGFAQSLGDDANFYKVLLRDSCDDDGDVVELLVNGQPMGTVVLRRAGVTLRLPLARGANTVSLRAVEDGRGGVTVGFQTEEGAYTARRLRVGKEVTLGVVVR